MAQRRSGGSAEAQRALLQLQRQYGNQHVQRVLELVRQPEGEDEERRVQRAPEEEEVGELQAERQGGGESEVAPEVEAAINRKRGGGQALDSGTRAQMGAAFGTDFSGVRVHTDREADTLNRALGARAFATGRNIFFRQGEYSPSTTGGQKLLAHELTHVVQQNGEKIRGKLVVSRPNHPFEQEADQMARMFSSSLSKAHSADAPPDRQANFAKGQKLGPNGKSTRNFDSLGRRSISGHTVRLVQLQRDLRDQMSGQWPSALVELNSSYSSASGIVARQKEAVDAFAAETRIEDEPSIGERLLNSGIELALSAALGGVGNIVKAAARRAIRPVLLGATHASRGAGLESSQVRSSIRTGVDNVIDKMEEAGKREVSRAVSDASVASDAAMVRFQITQKQALNEISAAQITAMNTELATLRVTEGEDDEWAVANAIYDGFRESLDDVFDEQYAKTSDQWFSMLVSSIGPGDRPGVLQIRLAGSYPNVGAFRVVGANLTGPGSTDAVRRRLSSRPLREISMPKVIRMNGSMGLGILPCEWYVEVVSGGAGPAHPTIRAPGPRLGPQDVAAIGSLSRWGRAWLAAHHLGLDDLDNDDARNTRPNQWAGAEDVWSAVKTFTPRSISNSGWG